MYIFDSVWMRLSSGVVGFGMEIDSTLSQGRISY